MMANETNDFMTKVIRPAPTIDSKVCSINIGDMESYRKVQDSLKKYGMSISGFLTNCCKLYVEIEEHTEEDMVEISDNPLENAPTEFTGIHENLELWRKWYKSLTKEQYKEYDRAVFTPQWKARPDKDDPIWKQRLFLHNQVYEQELWYKEVFPTDQ